MTVDPHHRVGRLDLDDAVFDLNEPGLMVAFRVGAGGTILFISFRDLWNR